MPMLFRMADSMRFIFASTAVHTVRATQVAPIGWPGGMTASVLVPWRAVPPVADAMVRQPWARAGRLGRAGEHSAWPGERRRDRSCQALQPVTVRVARRLVPSGRQVGGA